MIETKWFGNTVWETVLDDIDNQSIIDYAYHLKSTQPGQSKSSRGGLQYYNLIDPPNSYIKLLDVCNEAVMEVHLSMGLKKEYPSFIQGSWININPPQSFNIKHLHPRSLFSGVYYPKIPNGDSGDIIFYRDSLVLSYIPEYIINEYNDINSGTALYKLKTGMLLIFPSWLEHSVTPNFTDEDRISIAFNTNYDF